MSDDKVPSGDTQSSSAAEKKDSVSYETYQRVLAQRKSDQAELDRIKKEYQQILDVKKQEEEHKLNEAGEYKKLIELRDQKIKEIADEKEAWAKKFSESESRMQSIKKYAAFNSKLPAPLAHEDYYSLVDFNQIAVDPETGDVDQDSVEKLVNNFVKVHGNRVLKTGTTKMPNEASTTSSKVDYNDWLKMPVKEQLKVRWNDLKNVP